MKTLLSKLSKLAATALLAAVTVTGVQAADYPSKPIKFIVPYGAGGASDVTCRIVAKHMEKALGQRVVIVNVKGAGGAVGWKQVMGAKPDGYTVTMWVDSVAVKEATKAGDFTHKDFDPVAMFGKMYITVFGKGEGGKYGSLADYKADAASNPGKIGLAMGRGTPAQFVAAMVENALGEDLNLVNVGGGAKKKAAVLGGHVHAGIEPMPGIIGPHKSGQLKVLAVLAEKRIPGFDVPTAREQGVDVVGYNSYGIIAPKGTPKDRIAKLESAVASLKTNAEFQAELAKVFVNFSYKNQADWSAHMDDVRMRMLKIGKDLGF